MKVTISEIGNTVRWLIVAASLPVIVMLMASACLPQSEPPPPPPEPPKNEIPVIKSLSAEPINDQPGKFHVVCTATDPEGDLLEYWWKTDGGMIEGKGNTITWTAPISGGNHEITVMVKDNKGAEASETVAIIAESTKNDPPRITKVTIDNKEAQEVNTIKILRTVNLHCVAEDPEGGKLNYLWSATGGRIKGEGPIVQWISPGVSDDHIVRVKVVDERGAEAEAMLNFFVKCCGR